MLKFDSRKKAFKHTIKILKDYNKLGCSIQIKICHKKIILHITDSSGLVMENHTFVIQSIQDIFEDLKQSLIDRIKRDDVNGDMNLNVIKNRIVEIFELGKKFNAKRD